MLRRSLSYLCLLFILLGARAQNHKIMVHDPVAIQAQGKYYLFNTGRGIACWVSDDMKDWRPLPPVFSSSPEWAKKAVPKFDGNIWAPDVSYHNGKYYLYYSISSFASNKSCIGLATNITLDSDNKNFKWIDHGPVISSVPGRDMWNAVDPNLVYDENNQPWLAFGSFWEGIKIVKLDSGLLSVAKPQEWHTIASRQRNFLLDETDPGNAAVEAPFVFKKNDYYYLFVSFDLCCRGERSNYNVRVGRSKSVTGPYVDKDDVPMVQGGGTLVIGPDEKYYGQGHNSIYTFNGKDYMFCHAYTKNEHARPGLVILKVEWNDKEWPVVTEIE